MAILLVDKPAGPTSHDIVARIRRGLPRRTRVGHAGTLDPFATGLLVVAIGRATRLLRFISGVDKTYRARIQLGATSVTGDTEGPIVATGRPIPTSAAIAAAVAALDGTREQRVPEYSAVSVGGERLYARARRGEVVDRPSRTIMVREVRLGDIDVAAGWFDVELTCSSGTYVRQIAVDLGETFGCGGYCSVLRRTHVGALDVRDAGPVDQPVGDDPLSVARVLDAVLLTEPITDEERRDVGHGRLIRRDAARDGGPVALMHADRIVAVAEPADGVLTPVVVLI
jgi:tRNA pseudouridine55 synthase